MDSMTNRGEGGQPYGLLLLSLSVVGILMLGLAIAAVAGLAATGIDAALFGWQPTLERVTQVMKAAGSEHSRLGLRAALVLSSVVYGAIIVAILVFAHWRGGKSWRDLVAWRPLKPALTDRWLWAIVAAAILYSIAAAVLLDRFDQQAQFTFKIPEDSVASLILIALAVVVAPVTEELLFRGWIYTGLRHKLGLWPALLLSSALFAVAHYEDTHIYALAVFPVGLALGGLRERSGSIKAPILFHALYNLATVALAVLD